MKKILITGVFSTGKTSLIKLIKDKLEYNNKKTLVINEVARENPYALNLKQDLISTSWMVMRQLQNELQTDTKNYDFIIFDRGLPDIIPHTEYISNDKLFLNQLKLLAVESCKRFDYIFLSKISKKDKIEDDGIRIVDYNFQKELERLHIDCLKLLKVSYIELPETNNERVPFIISQIN
jgi:predicted ATPase